MKNNAIHSPRHRTIFFLLAGTFILNVIFFLWFSKAASHWLVLVIDIVVLFTAAVLIHRWIFIPYWRIVKFINDYSSTEELSIESSGVNNYLFPHVMLKRIIEKYKENEKQQKGLMQQLKHSNDVLQRNNRIMDSFIQINNEILSSGDIETVLQSILNKAIDIIPNAQKGSILIFDGNEFQFKAVKGYEFDILKNFKFNLEEAFQFGSKDFYEPIIINDVEAYNRKRLSKDRFNTLKEGRAFELKSTMSCAIEVDNELYGLINVDNVDNVDAFSVEDKPLIKHLAIQIGMALKNASLLEKIIYLSRHDSLTGLYNRNYFEELINRLLEEVLETNGIFSLAMLDINDLKLVNDTYGHEAGDLLIKNFAEVIAGHLESNNIFARMGGDEFTIVFPDKNKDHVEKVMENVNEFFSNNPFTYCGREIINISYCCGVATYPTDSRNIDTLIRMADGCMYDFKKKKKAAN